MNAFFSFYFLWFIYQNVSNSFIIELWNKTCRYEILHTLNLGCSFSALGEPCNNQRPRCDIAWLHVANHLYHGFPSSIVEPFNSENVVYILLNSKILKQWTCIVLEKHATFLYGIHVNTWYLIVAAKLSNAGFSVANWQYLIAAAKLSNAGFSVANWQYLIFDSSS